LPNLSFESMPPSSDEVFDWLESWTIDVSGIFWFVSELSINK
jgi:hypothetical protein